MVAREGEGSPGGPEERSDTDPVSGLFRAWRLLVTACAGFLRKAAESLPASRPARALSVLADYLRDPAGTIREADDDRRARLAEAGAAALALGAALSYPVGALLGVAPLQRFLAIAWTAGWALVRLLVLRLAGTGGPFGQRGAVEAAWGASLLPYALAVAWPLDLLALALSAYVARRNLVALGARPEVATRSVALAFGGQAVAEALSWVARSGLILGLAVVR